MLFTLSIYNRFVCLEVNARKLSCTQTIVNKVVELSGIDNVDNLLRI